nr:acetoacetate decarboxylase [Trichoderma asperellum]
MYLMYLQSFYNYSLHLDTSCTKRRLYFRPLGSTDAVLPSAPGNVDNNPDIKPCRFQLFTVTTMSSTIQIEFGGHKIDVPKGGYYDRYRMNPILDEVARDPSVGPDIEFFRKIPKRLVNSRVGETFAPNFYYRTRSIQLVFLAPLGPLKSKLPSPLEPISPFPGYGLVALTFYSYLVCDNDPYNEVSLAIIVRQPGRNSYSMTQLLTSIWNRTFYGYVLALPVDTEIARVRGVTLYQLPKWLTKINFEMDDHQIKAGISGTGGSMDLTLEVPLPTLKTIPSQSSIGINNAINKIDGKWHQVTVQMNPLLAAQCLLPRNVGLTRGEGPLSKLLNELQVSTILRMDILKDAQMALNMPTKLENLQ